MRVVFPVMGRSVPAAEFLFRRQAGWCARPFSRGKITTVAVRADAAFWRFE